MLTPQGCCSIAAPTSTRAPSWTMLGVGGQTAIFHAVTQWGDQGLPMAQLLVERGANLTVRVKLPGHYERPDELVECTALGYTLRFQNESLYEGRTVAFLQDRGAIE